MGTYTRKYHGGFYVAILYGRGNDFLKLIYSYIRTIHLRAFGTELRSEYKQATAYRLKSETDPWREKDISC